MFAEVVGNTVNILHLFITIQSIILRYTRVVVDRELTAYILISFAANVGMKYNFFYFSYNASKIVYFNLIIPSMILIKRFKEINIFLFCSIILVLIFLFSYFKLVFEGTIYVFGLSLLYYMKEVLLEIKLDFSKCILNILILISFTYNLFFLGLSNHTALWISSPASHSVLYSFSVQLILLYLLIFFENARTKY